METKLNLLSFWSINGELDETRLARQLESMRADGFDGVCFHPRFYPNRPAYLGDAYMRLLSRTILRARDLGMTFWLYDENGWPSGTVGGELPARFPEYRTCWLEAVDGETSDALVSFTMGDGARVSLSMRHGHGLDYLNPAATAQFIAMTHERYREALDPAAFEHVEAIFTDEPVLGSCEVSPARGLLPWSAELPRLWQEHYGEPLLPRLHLLFVDSDESGEFRLRFREFLTDRIIDGFFTPCKSWCEAHGWRFTGHIKGEEHPAFQTPLIGSCHQVYPHFSLPGIDSLERYPHANFFPRQLLSASCQFGTGECMVEAAGGGGWGVNPEHFIDHLGWLADNGLTHFALHMQHYALNSLALHDWPPSTPNMLAWREAFPAAVAAWRRRDGGPALRNRLAELLVISPHRAIATAYQPWELSRCNIHDGDEWPATEAGCLNTAFMTELAALDAAGTAYHLCDERSFETHARRLPNGTVRVGACSYRQVIAGSYCRLGENARALTDTLGSPRPVTLTSVESAVVTRLDNEGWLLDALPSVNRYLLDFSAVDEGRWRTVFHVAERLSAVDLLLADAPERLLLNGVDLTAELDGEWHRVVLSPERLETENELVVSGTGSDGLPIVAVLEGAFRVITDSGWAVGPNGTVRTEGPFRLTGAGDASSFTGDLLGAGYGFCGMPVRLYREVELPVLERGTRLSLGELDGSAAKLSIDGVHAGWGWGGGWQVELCMPIAAGMHRLELALYPSTYNVHGPHHYYLGDAAVISPGQFAGERNFADPPDAPACTHVSAWHFRPFGTRLPDLLDLS